MARVAGVDLPPNKRAEVGLTYIYGIGRSRASSILNEAAVNLDTRVRDLSEDELSRIRAILEAQGEVEGDLRKRVQMDIKRLMDIGCYRGLRHRRSLPVRGQRTHTNARTRKGPRRGTVANKKKATGKTYDRMSKAPVKAAKAGKPPAKAGKKKSFKKKEKRVVHNGLVHIQATFNN